FGVLEELTAKLLVGNQPADEHLDNALRHVHALRVSPWATSGPRGSRRSGPAPRSRRTPEHTQITRFSTCSAAVCVFPPPPGTFCVCAGCADRDTLCRTVQAPLAESTPNFQLPTSNATFESIGR